MAIKKRRQGIRSNKDDKRRKGVKVRPDSKIENSKFEDEILERYYAFEYVSEIAEDITSRGLEICDNTINRWAKRHGHNEGRLSDRDRLLDIFIARGLNKRQPVDAKTALKAVELKMKKHKEIDSGVTPINIQIVTPQDINERVNKANRLHPYIGTDK